MYFNKINCYTFLISNRMCVGARGVGWGGRLSVSLLCLSLKRGWRGGSWVFVVRVGVGGGKEMLIGYSYPSKVTSPLWV